MKVLWLTNVIPEVVANDLKIENDYAGGWISGLYNSLNKNNITFSFCFPYNGKSVEGKSPSFTYYGFAMKRKDYYSYSPKITEILFNILQEEKPDVIHVFGTEFPYTLSMVEASKKAGYINKLILYIQGLVSVCKNHFFAEIPEKVRYGITLKELVRNNNLQKQYKSFCRRSIYEIRAIEKCKYIVGRTEWDKACVYQINPHAIYFSINENLRDSFYKTKWKYDNCEKHTIFISQGNYPIKGLHVMLKAFNMVKKKYPDSRLKIAGDNIVGRYHNIKRRTSYAKYLREIIKKYNLECNIDFLGPLNEKEMCKQYLKAHVFVSPSSIENSSNSVSEALLLGVPVVASNVGGISSLINSKENGILYPFNEYNMLAYYIDLIFSKTIDVKKMVENEINSAEIRFNRNKNSEEVIKLYTKIVENVYENK